MTGSSPTDLAVTFRSLARRLREALEDGDAAAAAAPVAQLQGVVSQAATEMGTSVEAGADLAGAGAAIAAAIEAVPADGWDDARLSRLRALALEAGSLLRTIEALAQQD